MTSLSGVSSKRLRDSITRTVGRTLPSARRMERMMSTAPPKAEEPRPDSPTSPPPLRSWRVRPTPSPLAAASWSGLLERPHGLLSGTRVVLPVASKPRELPERVHHHHARPELQSLLRGLTRHFGPGHAGHLVPGEDVEVLLRGQSGALQDLPEARRLLLRQEEYLRPRRGLPYERRTFQD